MEGYTNTPDQLQESRQETQDVDCQQCEYRGPFHILNNNNCGRVSAICPNCRKESSVISFVPQMDSNGKIKNDKDGKIIMSKNNVTAQKLDRDGAPVKDKLYPRIPKYVNDPDSGNTATISPFTEEREEYKNESRQNLSASKKNIEDELCAPEEDYLDGSLESLMLEASRLDFDELDILATEHPAGISVTAAVEIAKEVIEGDSHIHKAGSTLEKVAGHMYQATYTDVGPDTQWCPKLRRSVSYFVCADYCTDARREPAHKDGTETYSESLIKGGDEHGKIVCGYKKWIEREVDKFYPGWINDHIIKSGGSIPGGGTPYTQRINLEEGQRRKMPHYPSEVSIEQVLEERHQDTSKLKKY